MGSCLEKYLRQIPLISLHGFLGVPGDFSFLKSISDSIVHLDYFKDPLLSPAHSWAEWGVRFWQHPQIKDLESLILVGYSLGGRLATQAFIQAPHRVKALVLISSAIEPIPVSERDLRQVQDEKWAESFLTQEWNDVIRAWNSQKVFLNSQEPERHEDHYHRRSLAQALVNWSPVHMLDVNSVLKQHREKIMVIAGESDSKYSQAFLNLQERGVISHLQIISNAGHRTIFDQPAAVTHAIERFLQDVDKK